jgi:hypothetical protein|tara:strand:+ start:2029 stop:2145 length:117 start_codon:yes stop_codon:yes gene_type:complete
MTMKIIDSQMHPIGQKSKYLYLFYDITEKNKGADPKEL